MLCGGQGNISVTANIAPRLMHELCMAAIAGDIRKAMDIQFRLMPVHKNLFVEANPIPLKWAMARMGLCAETMRLPLTPMTTLAGTPGRGRAQRERPDLTAPQPSPLHRLFFMHTPTARSLQPTTRLGLIALAASLATGCSVLQEDKIDYKSSQNRPAPWTCRPTSPSSAAIRDTRCRVRWSPPAATRPHSRPTASRRHHGRQQRGRCAH